MKLISTLLCLATGIVAGLCLFVATMAAAESLANTNLIWDSETKATNIISGANEAHFTFSFTNVSSGNVTISNVQPSCGCTTAQLPPLPWVIAPGTNGQIGITVNLAGKTGAFTKTINVSTDNGSKMLSVQITMVPPAAGTAMSDADREKNITFAQADRQAIFRGDCASCHVKQGEGKFGKELFESVCGVCHEAAHRATMVPDLHNITAIPTNYEFWRTWISYGREGSLMAAFSTKAGGPLSDSQIASLANYLATAIPSKMPDTRLPLH